MTFPVIQYSRSSDRTAIAFATSSGVVARPLGLRSIARWCSSGPPGMRRSAGVSVTPARIAFAVTPSGASSSPRFPCSTGWLSDYDPEL